VSNLTAFSQTKFNSSSIATHLICKIKIECVIIILWQLKIKKECVIILWQLKIKIECVIIILLQLKIKRKGKQLSFL
jgi:hypothetical protein